ncbi:MAG: type II toxin-antitoxin system PemK/MazF family toxin [Pseudonocardiales bacterium]|nr:type II toxin-antitoxin system PemK/MazF family toxin [Pseudonocardiales bacterium]
MRRGELWWVDFAEPVGSAPGYRRPAAVVSADRFNRSRIATVIVAAVTSNTRLADAPGNVALPAGSSGLPKDSVVNVSQLLAVDRGLLDRRIGMLPSAQLAVLDRGLRLVLGL